MKRSSLAALVLLVASLACKTNDTSDIPSMPPSIVGRVTAVTRSGERIGSIRVEENPADQSGSAKAQVRITQTTTVLRANASGDFNDLRVGDWVRAWFVGPVAESYPVQAQGGVVVVDSVAH